MNAKENALRIIHFDGPERAMTGCPTHGVAYRGANHEGYSRGGHHLPVGSRWNDIWGTGWHKEHAGVMGFPREHPLADLPHALRSYQWPDPDDERICGWIYEQARDWQARETFLQGSHRDTLWEKSYMLVGMQDLMCFFFTEPEAVRELLHRIMDFQLGIARHYLAIGAEMVRMGDDLGTQKGLLLSPQVIHEFLVPEYRRLFDLYKAHGVLVNFHSCGHVTPILETFMELGVDILNPVQATANDLDEMRRRTLPRSDGSGHGNGRGMALQGGIRSSTIYSGPIEAIRAEVAERLWQLGREGGYFCGPDQGMPWPEEHIQALRDAVEEFGRYPLDPPEQSGLVDRATL